jgi:hypothetical protein
MLQAEPVIALARAWQWQEELESGEYSSRGTGIRQ